MKCPACRRENRDGANYCRHCGQALKQPAAVGTGADEAALEIGTPEDEEAEPEVSRTGPDGTAAEETEPQAEAVDPDRAQILQVRGRKRARIGF